MLRFTRTKRKKMRTKIEYERQCNKHVVRHVKLLRGRTLVTKKLAKWKKRKIKQMKKIKQRWRKKTSLEADYLRFVKILLLKGITMFHNNWFHAKMNREHFRKIVEKPLGGQRLTGKRKVSLGPFKGCKYKQGKKYQANLQSHIKRNSKYQRMRRMKQVKREKCSCVVLNKLLLLGEILMGKKRKSFKFRYTNKGVVLLLYLYERNISDQVGVLVVRKMKQFQGRGVKFGAVEDTKEKMNDVSLLTQLRWLLRVTQRKKKRKRRKKKRKRRKHYDESQERIRTRLLVEEMEKCNWKKLSELEHVTHKGNGELLVVIKAIQGRLCDSSKVVAWGSGLSSISELDVNLRESGVQDCLNLDYGRGNIHVVTGNEKTRWKIRLAVVNRSKGVWFTWIDFLGEYLITCTFLDREKNGLARKHRFVEEQHWKISMLLLGEDVMPKQIILLLISVSRLTEKNKSSEMEKLVKFEMGERQVKETIPKVKKQHNETWNEGLFDQAHQREVEDSVKTSCGVNRFYYDRTGSTSSREIMDTSLILIKAMERRICDSLEIMILGFRGGNTPLVTAVEKELAWKGFSTQLGRD